MKFCTSNSSGLQTLNVLIVSLTLFTSSITFSQCVVVAPVPNDACYQQVIAADSWCCDNSWDALCQSAYDACNPGGGGTDPCNNITPLIGCGTSTGASMSGTGVWDMGTCIFSTPGVELIYSFTATASGTHSIDVTSVTGGWIDFMWIDAALGCSSAAPWNCVGDINVAGNYGTMNWTAGNTYYILLDPEGTGAYTASFDINCPNPGGPVTASDCNIATPVCTNLNFAVDPNGFGLIDELCTLCTTNPSTNPSSANSGCLLSGELNSTWFTVNVAAGGTLEFSFGAAGGGNCYDWIMWPYDATTCADIIADNAPPVSCNWNSPCDSYTGVASTPPAGGSVGNFEPTMNVNTGDQYLICFSNYSSALTNVPLDFFGSADISCTPLPTDLLSFQGKDAGGYNLLDWRTAAEVNSASFDVERSYDGSNFEKIGELAGAGTDLDGERYEFADYHPGESITYYRLKHHRFNEGFDYSDVIAVTRSENSLFKVLSVYPNPVNEVLNVRLISPVKGAVDLVVREANGRPVSKMTYTAMSGVNTIVLPVSQLSAGMYLVSVTNPETGESEVVRFTVK